MVTTLAVVAAGALVGSLPANGAPTQNRVGTYIVQLTDAAPRSMASTGSNLAGRRVDPAAAQRLRAGQDRVLGGAGVRPDRVVYRYALTFPGFAARLTPAQADAVARTPGVARVWRDEERAALTISTPDFLGLTGDVGVWQRYFTGPARAGEGVVIGVIDSGVAVGHPSFAPLPEPRSDAATIAAKWRGSCHAEVCNNKVIGARWFRAGATDVTAAEFDSPRDYNGHGTHMAAVAAGNHGVPAVVAGTSAGAVSGVAPAARLAVYKALWHTSGGRLFGSTADIVAAIDQATADGVDVLNYAAAGSTTSVADPVSVAFYHAAAAGVFVAAAAGNDGQRGAVGSLAPWVTTVAAGTHDRVTTRTVQLGDGTLLTGSGLGAAAASSTRIVDAAQVPAAAATSTDAELCRAGSLNPAAVTGAIVLCRHGSNRPTDKSRAVRDAGGTGMILYNDPDAALDVDFHVIATVSLNRVNGLRVKRYAATPVPTAQIAAAVPGRVTAPAVAATSSPGPARLAGVPVLKPDLLAPGVDVLAATVVTGAPTFGFRSGSSVATAQVSGVAALLIGRTPTLSPMAVKSALMTTAGVTDNSGGAIQRGTQAAGPHDRGAGAIRPTYAFDPGLTIESTPGDWLAFACGTDPAAPAAFGVHACAGAPATAPRAINQPALSDGAVAHTVTFRRTVRNGTNSTAVYQPRVTAPPGYTVTVTPASVTVLPRRTAAVTVTVTRTDALFDRWEFGDVVLVTSRHQVRLPLTVRAVAAAVPDGIHLTGASGTASVPMTAGYTGTLAVRTRGPVAPQRVDQVLDPRGPVFNPGTPVPSGRTSFTRVDVPEGGVARFATRAADHPPGTDIDIHVYRMPDSGAWVPAGASNGAGSDEEVTVDRPGRYAVFHHLYAAPAPTPMFGLHWVAVDATPAFVVRPAEAAVTAGAAVPLTATWSGLGASEMNLAVLELTDGTRIIGRSVVTIATVVQA